jgi:hypothetical protein
MTKHDAPSVAGRKPHYTAATVSNWTPPRAPANVTRQPTAGHAPVIPRGDLVMTGFHLGVHACNAPDLRSINGLVADANSADELVRLNGFSALFGAATAISTVLTGLQRSGRMKINGHIPNLEEIEYALKTDTRRFNELLQILATAMNAVRDVVPDLSIPIPSRQQREEAKPAEPIAVRVVSQPSRVTTTRVDRNSSGEIVSTFQLQEDVLKPDGQP